MNRPHFIAAVASMLGASAVPVPARAVLRSPVVTRSYPDLNLDAIRASQKAIEEGVYVAISRAPNGTCIVHGFAILPEWAEAIAREAVTAPPYVTGVAFTVSRVVDMNETLSLRIEQWWNDPDVWHNGTALGFTPIER